MFSKSLVGKEMVAVHVAEEGSEDVNNIPVSDVRSNKPLGVHSLEDKQISFFQRVISAKINQFSVNIAAPNEISLSLSISKKAQENSRDLKKSLLGVLKDSGGIIFDKDVAVAYDYIEEIHKAIVFSFKAIESFCNESIPDDYVYKKTTGKGVEEHYGKEQIERWITTSEKIAEILPTILNCSTPKNEKLWSDFKNLERLRNEIIHSKSSVSSGILSELFAADVNKYLKSSLDLLNFFIKRDPMNGAFPLGFGESQVRIFQVNNTDEIFRVIE